MLTEMKRYTDFLCIRRSQGVHNFKKKGLYVFIGYRTWVYRGIHGVLTGFVLFITTGAVGNSFMHCRYMGKLKAGINIHVCSPNLEQDSLKVCESMP